MQPSHHVPKIVWMYWENKPGASKPDYLGLCQETIERHSGDYELRVLNEKSVAEFLDLPEKVFRLEEIAHRADYIRFHLLERFGGVWLDADVVLLRPLAEAIEPFIGGHDFIGYGREPGKPSINFMACLPGCVLMRRQCAAIQNVLDAKKVGLFNKKVKLVWTEIGHDTLWDLATDYSYYHHSRERIAPLFWREWESFLSDKEPLARVLEEDPFMVMLYNDFMRKPLQHLSRDEILRGDMLLSKVLRAALGIGTD